MDSEITRRQESTAVRVCLADDGNVAHVRNFLMPNVASLSSSILTARLYEIFQFKPILVNEVSVDAHAIAFT